MFIMVVCHALYKYGMKLCNANEMQNTHGGTPTCNCSEYKHDSAQRAQGGSVVLQLDLLYCYTIIVCSYVTFWHLTIEPTCSGSQTSCKSNCMCTNHIVVHACHITCCNKQTHINEFINSQLYVPSVQIHYLPDVFYTPCHLRTSVYSFFQLT